MQGRRAIGTTSGRFDALVTDGHSRAAVSGVRALGQAGLRVLVVGSSRTAPALWSRHPARRVIGPASVDPGFLEWLAELAAEHGPLVVHPAQEEALDALDDAGIARLPPEAILAPASPASLDLLRDKARLAELAREVGLRAPLTLAQGTAGVIAAASPPAPCVVKSTGMSLALPNALLVRDDAELATLLRSLPADEAIVVQEHVSGALLGLALVLDRDGRVVRRFQQLARRLWPVDAGASTLAVSVAADEELVQRAAELLRRAGFWGLAHMQFLADPGGPALIDVNPRYYGSMPLALGAGVNLPAAWQAVALGQAPPPETPYRTGVVYRWLEGDVRAAMKGHRGRLRSLAGRGACGAVWDARDPLPGALVTAESVLKPIGRRLPPPLARALGQVSDRAI